MPRPILLALLLASALPGAASAQQHRWCVDFHRNNCWPAPFQRADRELALQPWDAMKSKGWMLENTLGDHHFDDNSHELTRAGKLKLRSILLNSPEPQRVVFVLHGADGEATAIRLDTVRQSLRLLVPQGPLPEIAQTSLPPRGWPAESIDDISRKVEANRPAPVLPVMQSTTGG